MQCRNKIFKPFQPLIARAKAQPIIVRQVQLLRHIFKLELHSDAPELGGAQICTGSSAQSLHAPTRSLRGCHASIAFEERAPDMSFAFSSFDD
jgi:hypothetical protein